MKNLIFVMMGLCISSAYGADLNVNIDANSKFQKIDHFTASDAWSPNFVGKYFDTAEKEKVAKWLFSQGLDSNGNPEGIGLSMWRVNLGGGSLEQDNADIIPFNRRAESFLTKDGSGYDWEKCAGQQYFMKKAREYGCTKFLLFSNTPPVQYTINGKSYCDKGHWASNLKAECYEKFAQYMAKVAKHFTDKGYEIKYISPVNEPQGDWHSNRQEGSPWRNDEIYRIVVNLDNAIQSENLKDTKILIGESGNIRCPVETGDIKYPMNEWGKTDNPIEVIPVKQIKTFFDENSKYYVGNLKSIKKFWAAHAYDSSRQFKQISPCREAIAKESKKYGIEFLQSEWCLLPDVDMKKIEGFSSDWKNDTGSDMQSSLMAARTIAGDLAIGQSTGWGYWKGVEINGSRSLISIYPKDGDITKGGNVASNKMLWALGNFSRFIRPDYIRVKICGADNFAKTFACAFISPDSKSLVVVFVNSAFSCDNAKIAINGFSQNDAKIYRTSDNEDLALVKSGKINDVELKARSITTIVFNAK